MKEKLQEKVRKLIEDRIIEATKKQVTQKLISISKNLGRTIISQNIFDNKLEDPWRLEEDLIYDPTKISLQDPEEWNISERGYYFDGLKCGINLCVTSLIYEEKVSELKATYNGYLVFAEVEGELKAYAPFPAWENAVDMFYEGAIQIEKKKIIETKAAKEIESKKKVKTFWNKFKMLWGY